jgi:hypothetical protein
MSSLDEVLQFLSQVSGLKEAIGMDKALSFVRLVSRLKDELKRLHTTHRKPLPSSLSMSGISATRQYIEVHCSKNLDQSSVNYLCHSCPALKYPNIGLPRIPTPREKSEDMKNCGL